MSQFTTENLHRTAMNAIKKHKLWWMCDVVAYLPCSHDTFYRRIAVGSEEYEEIVKSLSLNRIREKIELRTKIKDKNESGGLLALYKILCSQEERKRLSLAYVETKDAPEESEKETTLDLSTVPTNILEQLEDYLNGLNDDNQG